MKKFLSLFFAVVMCVLLVLPAYASNEGIAPCYNNTAMATADFSISNTGVALVTISYTGYPDYATGATVNCKIEKKTLWWWSDVDGAEWTDTVEGSSNVVQHSHQLTKTGKYRLTYEITVYGTAGSPDVISNTIEKEY